MFAPAVLVVLLAPVWLGASVATVILLVLLRRSSSELPATGTTAEDTATLAARQARRHGGLATALAVVAPAAAVPVVAVLATIATRAGGLGNVVTFVLVPAVAAATFLGTHLWAETHRPRDRGAVRTATLDTVARSDVQPPGLRTWSLVVAAITMLAATVPSVSAMRTEADPAVVLGFVPFAVGVLVVTAATVAAHGYVLSAVARRPVVPGVDPAWDADLRRLTAHRVLRGTQCILGLLAATTLLSASSWLSPVLALAAFVLALAVVAVAVVPAPAPREPAPALPEPTPASRL